MSATVSTTGRGRPWFGSWPTSFPLFFDPLLSFLPDGDTDDDDDDDDDDDGVDLRELETSAIGGGTVRLEKEDRCVTCIIRRKG